jgi:hypothetical protein
VPKTSSDNTEPNVFASDGLGCSSKEKGIEGTFGWLQAPATNHSLSFQSLSLHPSSNLGPIESKIQALPTVSICPKRAAKTRPSCDIARVYPIVVRASDCPSRFSRVAIGTCS